jgi:hypothetical protein
MDWNNFTPPEFVEYCKEVFKTFILPELRRFYEGLYNFSTWLEESICPPTKQK